MCDKTCSFHLTTSLSTTVFPPSKWLKSSLGVWSNSSCCCSGFSDMNHSEEVHISNSYLVNYILFWDWIINIIFKCCSCIIKSCFDFIHIHRFKRRLYKRKSVYKLLINLGGFNLFSVLFEIPSILSIVNYLNISKDIVLHFLLCGFLFEHLFKVHLQINNRHCKVKLVKLPNVHTRNNTKRIDADIHMSSVFKLRHFFMRNYLGDNTFITMPITNLITNLYWPWEYRL